MPKPEAVSVRRLSKLEQAIKKHLTGREGIGQIELQFLFGHHGSAEDAARWEQDLGDADIVLFEGVKWMRDGGIEIAQLYASGKRNPAFDYARLRSQGVHAEDFPWFEELFRILYEKAKEKKRVARPIDVSDEVRSKSLEVTVQSFHGYRFELAEAHIPFDDALHEFTKRLHSYAHHVLTEREADVVRQLPHAIRLALKSNPELLKRRPLQVRVVYGGAHTGIYHAVKRGGADALHPTASRKHASPHVFSIWIQVARKLAWGRPVSPEMFLQSFAGCFIPEFTISVLHEDVLTKLLGNTNEFVRVLLWAYSEEEIRRLYDYIYGISPNMEEAETFARQKATLVLEKFLRKR